MCCRLIMSFLGFASEAHVKRLERELKETRQLLSELESKVADNALFLDQLIEEADAAEDERPDGPELAKSDELLV